MQHILTGQDRGGGLLMGAAFLVLYLLRSGIALARD